MGSGASIGSGVGTGVGTAVGAYFGGVGAPIGGAIGGALGGVVGGLFDGSGDAEAAKQQAIDRWLSSRATHAGPTAFNNLAVDPGTREAQLQALAELQQVYKSGGLDPNTKAQENAIQQSNAMQAKAQQDAIANQMAQRGMSNSGAAIAGQRASAQQAAMNNYNQGMQALALGRQQQLAALKEGANLAGDMRSQDYTVASNRAAANDALSKFNAQNQTNFEIAKDQGLQGAYTGIAGYYSDRAQQNRDTSAGLGQMIGGIGGALGANKGSSSTFGAGTDEAAKNAISGI